MQKEVVAVAVRLVEPMPKSWIVFLGNEEKTFIIYVDPFVGNAIQMALNGIKRERPLTHDLIGSILLGLGARLDYVVINETREILINESREVTFYARVFLRMDNELGTKIVEIDARPSDSIVLALQQKRPIYVARSVLDAAEDRTEDLEQVLRQKAQESEGDSDSEEGEAP